SRSITARATVSPPKPLSNMPSGRASIPKRYWADLEVDDLLGFPFGLVEVVGERSGGEVLPPGVSDDEDDHALVDLLGDLDGAGHRGAGGDPDEQADVGQATGPLE